MTQAKMEKDETAAEKYARLKEDTFEGFLEKSFSEDALKNVELFEVTVPSGMKFKCRKIGIDYYTNIGQMPMSLSETMLAAESGEVITEARQIENFKKMTPLEQRSSIQVAAQMIRYIAVEPRLIIGEVNGHKNAISVDVLTVNDFNCLGKWAGGGDTAPGLKTFRRKRR